MLDTRKHLSGASCGKSCNDPAVGKCHFEHQSWFHFVQSWQKWSVDACWPPAALSDCISLSRRSSSAAFLSSSSCLLSNSAAPRDCSCTHPHVNRRQHKGKSIRARDRLFVWLFFQLEANSLFLLSKNKFSSLQGRHQQEERHHCNMFLCLCVCLS